jgi:hypothetical protein
MINLKIVLITTILFLFLILFYLLFFYTKKEWFQVDMTTTSVPVTSVPDFGTPMDTTFPPLTTSPPGIPFPTIRSDFMYEDGETKKTYIQQPNIQFSEVGSTQLSKQMSAIDKLQNTVLNYEIARSQSEPFENENFIEGIGGRSKWQTRAGRPPPPPPPPPNKARAEKQGKVIAKLEAEAKIRAEANAKSRAKMEAQNKAMREIEAKATAKAEAKFLVAPKRAPKRLPPPIKRPNPPRQRPNLAPTPIPVLPIDKRIAPTYKYKTPNTNLAMLPYSVNSINYDLSEKEKTMKQINIAKNKMANAQQQNVEVMNYQQKASQNNFTSYEYKNE